MVIVLIILSSFFVHFFLKISFSLQKEESFWKTRKDKQSKIWTKFYSKKAILDQVLTLQHIDMCVYIYMCVCVCARVCCGVIIWAKFGQFEGYYLGQVGLFFMCLSKLSAHIFERKSYTNCLRGYYLGQVGHFCCTKVDPDNNPYLAQIITPQMFCSFLLLKCVKNNTFSQAKAQDIRNVVLQPPNSPKIGGRKKGRHWKTSKHALFKGESWVFSL